MSKPRVSTFIGAVAVVLAGILGNIPISLLEFAFEFAWIKGFGQP